MGRTVRYQGVLLCRGRILLVKHQGASGYEWWSVPGGGREAEDETEEQCVVRELREETLLEVRVERLLLDVSVDPGCGYQRFKTYLCTWLGGQPRIGCEPEISTVGLIEVRWFDLKDEAELAREVGVNPVAYASLLRVRQALG